MYNTVLEDLEYLASPADQALRRLPPGHPAGLQHGALWPKASRRRPLASEYDHLAQDHKTATSLKETGDEGYEDEDYLLQDNLRRDNDTAPGAEDNRNHSLQQEKGSNTSGLVGAMLPMQVAAEDVERQSSRYITRPTSSF